MYRLTDVSTRTLQMMAILVSMLAMLAAAGCSPVEYFSENDYGDYYAEHPRANTVNIVTRSYDFSFEAGSSKVNAQAREEFDAFIGDTSDVAVEEIVIKSARSDVMSDSRRKTIEALLANAGLGTVKPAYRRSSDLNAGDVVVEITHAQAVAPDCPDWSMSSTSNYSNDWHTNMRCASVTNLGRMVADPRDLVRGSGNVRPDPERSAAVIQEYRSGVAPGAASSGSYGGSSSEGGSGGN